MKKQKKSSVDDAIKELVNKEIASVSYDPEMEDISPDELESANQLGLDEKDHEVLNKLLASFPSTEGFYGKLYSKSSNGKIEFKHHLDMLEEIDDPELEILNLIKDKGWDDGEYLLRVFKRGQPDCKKTITWRMSAKSKNPVNQTPTDNVKDKLAELSGLLNAVKDITPTPAASNPGETAKIMAEAFKSGVDVIKNNISTNKEDNGIEKSIEILSKLGLLKSQDKPVDSMTSTLQIITILKELGVIGKPEVKQDFYQELIKFKELGLIKMAGEDSDPFSQVEKIKSLIEVMAPLFGGEGLGGGKTSLGIELVKTLGPQVPKIIENITTAVSKIADVSKMKLSNRLGVNIPASRPSPQIPPINSVEEIIDEEQTIPNNEEVVMNPILKELHEAVISNNQEYFPKLKDLIHLYIGSHALESLLNQSISIDSFLSSVSTMLREKFLIEEPTKKYFESFLLWHNSEILKNLVVGVCGTCHEQYDYVNEDDFNKDSKMCDCGGTIEKQSTNTVGHA